MTETIDVKITPSNVFYTFNIINSDDKDIPCEFDLNRSDLIDVSNKSLFKIKSFNFTSGYIPVYVAELIDEISYNNIISQNAGYSLPNGIAYTNGRTTNLMVRITYGNYKYICPIIWEPEDNSNDNLFLTIPDYNRETVLNCPYYHAHNTLHLLQLVANAYNACFTEINNSVPYDEQHEMLCELTFVNNSITLLLKQPTINYTGLALEMNYELNRLLQFNVVNTANNFFGIIIKPPITDTITLQNIDYDVVSTYKTNLIFPFIKCNLMSYSSGLRNEKHNTTSMVQDTLKSIIASFNFNVNNPDNIYSIITYSSENNDDWINFLNNNGSFGAKSQFSIELTTYDNYSFRLYLKPKGYINCKFIIQV